MPLYVVMSNLPGPGARALLQEKLPEGRISVADETDLDAVAVEDLFAAVDGACEFVELENERGAGVGPDSGVTWQTESSFLSDKQVVKLGPFELPSTAQRVRDLRAALEWLANEIDAITTWNDELGETEDPLGAAYANAREVLAT